jgi:hypothetical protein
LKLHNNGSVTAWDGSLHYVKFWEPIISEDKIEMRLTEGNYIGDYLIEQLEIGNTLINKKTVQIYCGDVYDLYIKD